MQVKQFGCEKQKRKVSLHVKAAEGQKSGQSKVIYTRKQASTTMATPCCGSPDAEEFAVDSPNFSPYNFDNLLRE